MPTELRQGNKQKDDGETGCDVTNLPQLIQGRVEWGAFVGKINEASGSTTKPDFLTRCDRTFLN
jgi:hypothetical protein